MTVYGYARVSTVDQNLDAQLEQLRAAGCTKIFREKVSGARSDRPELAKSLKALGQGDTLVVSRLDRLARIRGRRRKLSAPYRGIEATPLRWPRHTTRAETGPRATPENACRRDIGRWLTCHSGLV